jgi:hypothetical protein
LQILTEVDKREDEPDAQLPPARDSVIQPAETFFVELANLWLEGPVRAVPVAVCERPCRRLSEHPIRLAMALPQEDCNLDKEQKRRKQQKMGNVQPKTKLQQAIEPAAQPRTHPDHLRGKKGIRRKT